MYSLEEKYHGDVYSKVFKGTGHIYVHKEADEMCWRYQIVCFLSTFSCILKLFINKITTDIRTQYNFILKPTRPTSQWHKSQRK